MILTLLIALPIIGIFILICKSYTNNFLIDVKLYWNFLFKHVEYLSDDIQNSKKEVLKKIYNYENSETEIYKRIIMMTSILV